MQDEPNTPDDGIDNVAPQAADTVEDWNYYDPDEDNVEEPEPETTDDGATEAEEATEAEPEEAPEIEAAPEAVVTLEDGSKVKVKDLIQGNLRQQDYTRKAQEVATRRKSLESEVQRLEGITAAFIDHLSGLVPAPPDTALLYSDERAYFRQKAQHEAALEQVQKLIEVGEKPKEVKQALATEERAELIADENRKLAERFPETAQKEGREKFLGRVVQAAEAIGFSLDDLKGVTDHRIFALAHYAEIGMKAAQARAVAAQKVAKAPPVATKRPGQGAMPANRNAEAMKRLSRSGSIKDAMQIDWD